MRCFPSNLCRIGWLVHFEFQVLQKLEPVPSLIDLWVSWRNTAVHADGFDAPQAGAELDVFKDLGILDGKVSKTLHQLGGHPVNSPCPGTPGRCVVPSSRLLIEVST